MKSNPIGEREYSTLAKYLFKTHNRDALRLVALLYYCGLRISEALQWSEAEIAQGVADAKLIAWQSKVKRKRDLPLTPAARQALQSLLDSGPRDTTAPFIGYADADSARVALNRYLRLSLGSGYTSHGFRRGLITDALRKGHGEIGDVQRLVGHISPVTTIGCTMISPPKRS